MDKNRISGHFWIFSHEGMIWRAAEASAFQLSQQAADSLKIENFNLKIFIYSKNRNFKLKNIFILKIIFF
jgi:hypothetical protein